MPSARRLALAASARKLVIPCPILLVIGLRNDGVISDDVLHRLDHVLNVEALRLGVGERRVSSGGDDPR